MRRIVKRLFIAAARILVFPAACLAGFGRWQEPFQFFAQMLALMPGIAGSYLRVAYYSFTLKSVGRNCHIAFGSFFAHSSASLGHGVGIGANCVLGKVDIGAGTLLAGGVQVLSGQRQHRRDGHGSLTDEGRLFQQISIGEHCWIGAGSIVMADIGARATAGPGSVVAQQVPADSTVSGNPARNFSVVLKSSSKAGT